jgi:hypothetical protein
MKLVMTLLVRNEQDILRENLEAHLALGVDFFLVMDHGSDDATPAILADYAARGLAEVFQQPDPGYYQARWVTWMARRAAETWGAEWVINADADEFWWPVRGDLQTALAEVPPEVGLLYVKRHNFRPVPADDGHFLERMVYRDLASTNSLGEPLPGKACHRGDARVEVEQGNHDAHAPGLGVKEETDAIEILHFPVRSLAQIERKIAQGGRAYELAPDLHPLTGHAWRHLYGVLNATGLAGYFSGECVGTAPAPAPAADPEPEREPAGAGRVIRDTRLRDFMRPRLGPR